MTPGSRIGRYEISRLLGTGGMGEVYLARDTRLRRPVAIKLLLAKYTQSRERLSRFEHEAYAASSLNHPNILTIHEIGDAEGCRFITSEYVEGESLRHHMSSGRMELTKIVEVTVQVASALEAAHEAGIVHRDIKPENIMLRTDGFVKVLDFGLAKLGHTEPAALREQVDQGAPTRTLVNTAPGVVMGTFNYMSPEQARGLEVDGRSDIWSLGVVMYEMLTGITPFGGETPSDVIAAILKTDPQPVGKYLPEFPQELQRILNRMLCKQMEGRHQSSHDLLLELRELKHELDLSARLGRLRENDARITATVSPGAREDSPAQSWPTLITRPSIPYRQSSAEYIASEVKRHKKSVVLVLAVLVVGLASAVYFTYFTPRAPITSLAVLPFSNVGGDQNLEYLSDGLSESLINRLSQLPQLKLIASSSSFKYKGKEIDPPQVARALGVQALVMGRVTQRGNDLQVSVELVDARDLTQLWGESYHRDTADLQAVVADISREVSTKLLTLSGEDQKRVISRSTNDADAYQLYLKGRFNWNKLTEDGLNKSIEFFNAAIEKDPQFALAYAGLANSYLTLGVNYIPPREAYPKASFFAHKALEFDDTLAEAHYAMAATKFFSEWNLSEADKEVSRTLELNPSYAAAYSLRSTLSLARGQTNDDISQSKHALDLDPFSLIFNIKLSYAYYYARQYPPALEQMKKTLELEPNASYLYGDLGTIYAQMGRYEDGLAACRKALSSQGDDPEALSSLGVIYALGGRKKEAEETIENLERLAKKKYVQPYQIALIYAALGQTNEAFDWLEKANDERSTGLLRIKVDPTLDKIRTDPRYEALLKRINLR